MPVIFLSVHKYLKCSYYNSSSMRCHLSLLLCRPSAAGCPEIRGLWVLPECVLHTAVHRIHLHPLVPGPGVPAHRRLLQLQDGPLERGLCVLRDCQVELRPAWHLRTPTSVLVSCGGDGEASRQPSLYSADFTVILLP